MFFHSKHSSGLGFSPLKYWTDTKGMTPSPKFQVFPPAPIKIVSYLLVLHVACSMLMYPHVDVRLYAEAVFFLASSHRASCYYPVKL